MTSRQDIEREEENLLEIEGSLARVEKIADDNLERIEDTLRLIDEALSYIQTNRAAIGESEYLQTKTTLFQRQNQTYELRKENYAAKLNVQTRRHDVYKARSELDQARLYYR